MCIWVSVRESERKSERWKGVQFMRKEEKEKERVYFEDICVSVS